MKISQERLRFEAETTGFRPEVLEKVIQLLTLLEGLRSHPFLKGRLALKGGTALNLFVFDMPRLSVDIDLNYIGAIDRETMLAERPKVEQAIQAVCAREGYALQRLPDDHAGGKWRLRYESALGQGGNLELDLNFMFRIPLWDIAKQDSRMLGSYQAREIPVLDLHELAAGKLAALLARRASRDLFDAHQLLTRHNLDRDRLRAAFVLYGAMNRRDWRTVSVDDVNFDPNELKNQLLPTFRNDYARGIGQADTWARRLVDECRSALGAVLPMSDAERAFLDRLLDHGEIVPSLLTADAAWAAKIQRHPLLEWKSLNVRQQQGR
ncbi:MAG: nucleotidyl transferase AbiEii/AbiGii toxin family protein [Burkholderiales bacterium]|nr:nucleotidyl transferase AbiEii/AbiGii toxin family protein [Burkholderiales bacterium]